ncbi:WAT1-related protein At5g40240 [Sesamum indicum]|uniref:WAT1-related protein n=1 Tax=Sesamum indicum TaxID=4182 RepID=A0A6I9UID3_SESIN|nr:WAT1-related protein At5g40240 [Sesamum indicum]
MDPKEQNGSTGIKENRNCVCGMAGEVVPLVAMLTVELTNVGMNILYKAAVSKGLNYHVYMVYSYGIPALILLPLAFFIHRSTRLPPFTLLLLPKFFILGFLGFTGQLLGYAGIAYSNPTLGSAISNLTPACTFSLAVVCRLEKLKLRSLSSQAKVIGALVSIVGALVVVLYDGPLLINGRTGKLTLPTMFGARSNWIFGGALLAVSYIVASIWLIFQGIVIKEYPAEFIVVFFYNFFAFVVAVPVCVATGPPLSSWAVPADVRLVSILYAGVMGSGFAIMIHTWGLHRKGPVYVAMFRPLSIAITAIMGVIFLGDDLYLGSVIGSVVIAMGFYTLMWGKTKEEIVETSNDDDILEPYSTGDAIVPLLKERSISTKANAGS